MMSLSSVALFAADDAVLTIGSKAPSIDVEHWVSNGHDKFKPVTNFESNQVYVVEFWATWCGPCVMSMPHLAETQEKYADKKVQLISISDEPMDVVEKFLAKPVQGSEDKENTYGKLTSAYCLTTDPDRSVYESYMKAAGQNGIPTAFIVGKTGLVEWVGHPMSMDEPLEKIVEDKWDREAFAVQFKKEQALDLLDAKIGQLARAGKVDEAMEQLAEARKEYAKEPETLSRLDGIELNVKMSLAMKKLRSGNAEEAVADLDALAEAAPEQVKPQIVFTKCQMLLSLALSTGKHADLAAASMSSLADSKLEAPLPLNSFARAVYETSAKDGDKVTKELLAAACKCAERAAELAPKNPSVLDTLAHLLDAQGDTARAIEVQTKAIDLAPANLKENLTKYLDELKKK